MGFLHKLWDETLAGPTPDTGLSKLRKFDSFHVPITRPNSNSRSFSSDSDRSTGPTTCRTPLTSRTPGGDFEKFARRKSSARPPVRAGTTTPTDFYWVMVSALDR